MNGCIVDLQTPCDVSGCGWIKDLIQRSDGVDIQIIHDQYYFFAVAVMNLYQLAQEMGKIHGSSGISQFYHSLVG